MAGQATARAKEQPRSLAEAEREAIVEAMRFTRGNTDGAAWYLNIGRTTVYRKMKAFEIEPKEYMEHR